VLAKSYICVWADTYTCVREHIHMCCIRLEGM
jgi:hypothetical protein